MSLLKINKRFAQAMFDNHVTHNGSDLEPAITPRDFIVNLNYGLELPDMNTFSDSAKNAYKEYLQQIDDALFYRKYGVKRNTTASDYINLFHGNGVKPVLTYCLKCKTVTQSINKKDAVQTSRGSHVEESECNVCNSRKFRFVKKR